MKKIILFIISLVITTGLVAQTANSINNGANIAFSALTIADTAITGADTSYIWRWKYDVHEWSLQVNVLDSLETSGADRDSTAVYFYGSNDGVNWVATGDSLSIPPDSETGFFHTATSWPYRFGKITIPTYTLDEGEIKVILFSRGYKTN